MNPCCSRPRSRPSTYKTCGFNRACKNDVSRMRAYVVGSGPNGLTAAITLARAGVQTTVLEAQPTFGGGARTAELTLPGFLHDVCSAAHPMAVSSPAFASFPLHEHGLEWIHSPAPLAHPLDDGSCVVLHRSVEQTARELGTDGAMYRRIFGPLTARWQSLAPEILAPLHIPQHPILLARFGILAVWPATLAARTLFRGTAARALLPALPRIPSCRSNRPIRRVRLGLCHRRTRGGLAGGARWITEPQQCVGVLLSIPGRHPDSQYSRARPHRTRGRRDHSSGHHTAPVARRSPVTACPPGYRTKLENYCYGPGVFKMDWALSTAIPWHSPECLQRQPRCTSAAHSRRSRLQSGATWIREPSVLLTQPSLFDPTRAPQGRHTAWAYCHVPNGSTMDVSERIEAQIATIRTGVPAVRSGTQHHGTDGAGTAYNSDLIGGDIGGGSAGIGQLFYVPHGACTAHHCGACTYVPHRRRRAAEFMECAVITQPERP